MPASQKQRLTQAIEMARAGAYKESRAEIVAYLHVYPEDADAWFWLACVTENPWEALAGLRKARALDPSWVLAEQGMIWAEQQISAGCRLQPMHAPYVPSSDVWPKRQTQPSSPARRKARIEPRWVLGLVSALAFLTVAGLVLGYAFSQSRSSGLSVSVALPYRAALSGSAWQDAWEAGDWEAAIIVLEELLRKEPGNHEWRWRLFDARVQQGQHLADSGRLEDALAQYDAAMSIRPYDTELQQARGIAARYRIGLERYQSGDWVAAVEVLSDIFEESEDYREVQPLLFSAHYNLGVAHQAAGRLDEAEEAYLTAARYRDDAMEAEWRLLQIRELRVTPTISPAKKRIEVSISRQRMYVYENDELIWEFICSTGYDASPTAPGSYHVQSKMPMAYASTWSLNMPYWLGIYWSGTLENGIHALPILPSGQVLWGGYLGQRVSYGCIVLSTEDAMLLYEWAEIGVPVEIYY